VLPAVYGKFIQRQGSKRWFSLLWASLVTAEVRARLLDAAAEDPLAIVMIATDALWSRRRLSYCEARIAAAKGREAPGGWRRTVHGDTHIVAPGLYWATSGRIKTRGWRRGDVEIRKAELERLWRHRQADGPPPSITVPIRAFVTLPLAQALHEPAGDELEIEMNLAYEWAGKRRKELQFRDGIWSSLPVKHMGSLNLPYRPREDTPIPYLLEPEI
jgi:hypothetical protein